MCKKAIKHTITLDYGEVTDISPDIRLTLHNAGHILGSAISHMHMMKTIYKTFKTWGKSFSSSICCRKGTGTYGSA